MPGRATADLGRAAACSMYNPAASPARVRATLLESRRAERSLGGPALPGGREDPMKLPIQTLGLMAAGLLIGTALSPVAAQSQQSSADGQVALRSDGALYLIQNGQRRWISTVPLADSDINAIPEGDPIMTGLAMAGSAEAQAQAKPSTAAPPAAAAKPAAGAPPAAGAAPP